MDAPNDNDNERTEMATRRERLEARRKRREEWASSRQRHAKSLERQNEPLIRDWAFVTQPGHIPERARVIRREERAWEDRKMAAHHEMKAAGLADQLDRSIFSDDADAVQQLEARIANLEAERDRIKQYNASCRKGFPDESLLDEAQRRNLESVRRHSPYQLGKNGAMPAYVLSNLGGNIKRNRDRLKDLQRRAEQQQRIEAAGGVLVCIEAQSAQVTFAEKPDWEIRKALKTAGFFWSGGSWCGQRESLPPIDEITNAPHQYVLRCGSCIGVVRLTDDIDAFERALADPEWCERCARERPE